MNIREYEEQLKSLVEHFNNGGLDFNATDIQAIKILLEENYELKEQLEDLELQNFNLKEDIMIKKMSIPSKEIKDKSFLDLYNMPSYEELLNQQQEFIEWLENEIRETTTTLERLSDTNSCRIPNLQLKNKLFKKILTKYKEVIGVKDE